MLTFESMVNNRLHSKEYYSSVELANLLGISRIAVYKRIRKGDIRARRIGRNFLVHYKTVEQLIPHRLDDHDRKFIDRAVSRTVSQFGEALKNLGNG